MLHDKTNRVFNRHYTIITGMHVLFAILCTDENGCSTNVVWIAWSTISGPLIYIGLASLYGVQRSPLRYFVTVESAIALEPRIITNYLWMIEADNLYLSRKRQIERWHSVHDVKFECHNRSFRNWNVCYLMSRTMSKQLFNGMKCTSYASFEIVNIWRRRQPQFVMLNLCGKIYLIKSSPGYGECRTILRKLIL
jgi:hypothetical protein